MTGLPSEGAPDTRPFDGGGRVIAVALALAMIGLGLCVVGFFVDPRQTFAAYLIAYSFVATVLLGLMVFVMAAHAMHAGWPVAVRRLAELGFGAMPLLAVLVVPLLLSVDELYPWMHPERISDHHVRQLVEHKRTLMNARFFWGRAVFFVLLWTLVAALLRRWSLAMDRPSSPDLHPRLRAFSSALLPLIGITGSLAAFDWLMSLSPDFYSTMYGLYVLSGGFVAAMGLMAIMMWTAQRAGFLVGVGRSHWYAIGRLLFAFLIFWAYTAFFQYLLIWIGNKPIEVKFYLQRIQPGDRWTSWFIVWGHFAVPWLILLSYWVKRHAGSITLLGAWILGCHYVDIHWLVGAHRLPAAPWQWQDAPALLFVGGATVAFAVWRQRGRLLSASYDVEYARAVAYESR